MAQHQQQAMSDEEVEKQLIAEALSKKTETPEEQRMRILEKLKAEGYDYFYIAYSFDESPFYNLDTDLFDIAMSLNSFLKVYDANSNEVSLDCKNQNQIKAQNMGIS